VRPWRGLNVGVVLAALASVFAACGSQRSQFPNLLDEDAGGSDGGGDGPAFADSKEAPRCQYGADGGPCGCLELSLLGDAPNLYFLLDRSGSMNDANKWSTVRTVVAKTLTKIGPRANFGAAVFPDPVGAACDPGTEVFAPQRGDSPAGSAGPTSLGFVTATNVTASGGTPTAQTIRALTPRIAGLRGKTFAILATDGGPNCDLTTTCGASTCIPNIESAGGCSPAGANCCDPAIYGPGDCLDGAATIDAVAALSAAGVPTYVIGVPGSGPYASLLDSIAVAGGTARSGSPRYYNVDSTDAAAFASALAKVAAKITATCVLLLESPPQDPTQVNVYLDDVVVPSDPANGWVLKGSTVTLTGTVCDRVMSGEVLDLRVIAGCATVPAK
jgi:hypothetical protein